MLESVANHQLTESPDTSKRSRLLAKIGAFGPAAVWLAGFAASAALRPNHASLSAALWGLLLLGSFVAWGRLVSSRSVIGGVSAGLSTAASAWRSRSPFSACWRARRWSRYPRY